MKIGFIGLGSMGLPMASNLFDAKQDIIVYNRTKSKAKELEDKGVEVAGSAREVAEQSDILITMLSDDNALLSVMYDDEVLDAMKEGTLHISMSTISAELAREFAEVHEEENLNFVSAPVFGRPDMATAGKLWIVAAGDEDSIEKSKPLFEILGRDYTIIGDKPFMANVIKVSGNFMIASMLEALGESFALVRKSGLDAGQFLEVIDNALFQSALYRNYGSMLVKESYTPAGFKLKHGLKDIRLALEAADEAEVPMPLASLMKDHYVSGVAKGWGEYDWSALGKINSDASGLE